MTTGAWRGTCAGVAAQAASILLALWPALAAGEDKKLFQPPGLDVWDVWFARQGDTFHAFFLQAPTGPRSNAAGMPQIGLATSRDLLNWDYHGPVLVAERRTWCDEGVATGSTLAHGSKWWMAYTGRGKQVSGVGLAVSDDLRKWKKVGDGPVISFAAKFEATWRGQKVRWYGIADPYIVPEPIEGFYYMVLNAGIEGAPDNERGCLAAMRSKDMLQWESAGVLAWPRWFDRMESPQLWHHGGRWYLYFGAAQDSGTNARFIKQSGLPEPRARKNRDNFIFDSDQLLGPYEPRGAWWHDLPEGGWGYIYKVLQAPDGREVLITTIKGKLSTVYPITYAPDGSVMIGKP